MLKPLVQGLLLCCAGFSMQAFALGYSQKYELCMRNAQSQSGNIVKCQLKEFKVQNKRMKKIFKMTLNDASAADRPLVKQSQTVWLQRRDNACGIGGKKLKEYSLTNSSCALQMTESHADMLEVRMGNKIQK